LGLQIVVGLASLACFVMVVIKMFQNGQTGLAIACILLIWCIGGLIALVIGWQNAEKWGIKNIMMIWTGLVVVGILLSVVQMMTAKPPAALIFLL
jgi:hypothetical protein